MAVSFVAAASANSGSTSQTSTSVAIPGSASVGDLLIAIGVVERNAQPGVSCPEGNLTSLRSTTSTNVSVQISYKTLTANDLGDNVSVTSGANRRQAIGLLVYSGAAAPAIQNNSVVTNNSSTFTLLHPNLTPTGDNALLIAVDALAGTVSPYNGRTVLPGGSYNERIDSGGGSAVAISPYIYAADLGLTGQYNSAQTGMTGTASNGSLDYLSSTIAIYPTSISGGLSVAGSGSMSDAGAPAVASSLGASGAGSQARSGSPTIAAGAGFSGSGSMSGAGVPAIAASAGLSGSGTQTRAGSPAPASALGRAGSGAGAFEGAPSLSGAWTASGTGTLDFLTALDIAAAVELGGSGSAAFSGVVDAVPAVRHIRSTLTREADVFSTRYSNELVSTFNKGVR